MCLCLVSVIVDAHLIGHNASTTDTHFFFPHDTITTITPAFPPSHTELNAIDKPTNTHTHTHTHDHQAHFHLEELLFLVSATYI